MSSPSGDILRCHEREQLRDLKNRIEFELEARQRAEMRCARLEILVLSFQESESKRAHESANAQQLIDELNKAKSEADAERRKCATAQHDLARANAERALLCSQLKEHEAYLINMKDELEAGFHIQVSELEKRARHATESAADLKKELKLAQDTSEALAKDNKQKATQIKDILAEYKELYYNCQALERELRTYKRSNSCYYSTTTAMASSSFPRQRQQEVNASDLLLSDDEEIK